MKKATKKMMRTRATDHGIKTMHKTSYFDVNAVDYDEEQEDEEEEDGDEDDVDTPLLPIFSAAHLDRLPLYNITHAIRLLIVQKCETHVVLGSVAQSPSQSIPCQADPESGADQPHEPSNAMCAYSELSAVSEGSTVESWQCWSVTDESPDKRITGDAVDQGVFDSGAD